MNHWIKFLMLLVVLIPCLSWGQTCTNTVTISYSPSPKIQDSGTVMYTMNCTAAANGTMPTPTIPLTSSEFINTPWNLFGYYLYAIGTTPGSPPANNDTTVVVNDTTGFTLANVTASNTVARITATNNALSVYPPIRSNLTVTLGATNAASGVISMDFLFKSFK